MNITELREFLKALEVALPPGKGHHGLSYCQYGSDSAGWGDRLGLHVRLPVKYAAVEGEMFTQTFFLDDADLEKSTVALVAEIVAEAREIQRQ